MSENCIKFKTSSPAGDLLSMLAGIRELWLKTGKRAIIYQRLNMVGAGTQDTIHPFENQFKEPVCMNEYMFNMLKPLLLNQEYIEDFIIYNGQNINYDLDKIRQEIFTNQPKGSINRWVFYAFPEMNTDLSGSWLKTSHDFNSDYSIVKNDKIIINFTQRYRNNYITYFFLKQYQLDIVFAGLKKERDLFCNEWGLDIPLLEVNDLLELADLMRVCKFYLSNASMAFQIAEGLKIPRILETFYLMPNVIPMGKNGYDFYSQASLEFHFNKLNTT